MVLFFWQLLDRLGSAERTRPGWRLPDLPLGLLQEFPGCAVDVRGGRVTVRIPVENGTAVFFATTGPGASPMLRHVVAEVLPAQAPAFWILILRDQWEKAVLSPN
jgi:hypothetical protein